MKYLITLLLCFLMFGCTGVSPKQDHFQQGLKVAEINPEKAINLFEASGTPAGWYNAGLLLLKSGKTAQACQRFELAHALQQELPAYQFQTGRCARLDLPERWADLKKAESLLLQAYQGALALQQNKALLYQLAHQQAALELKQQKRLTKSADQEAFLFFISETDTLVLSGKLSRDTPALLEHMLAQHPHTNSIILNSSGGNLRGGLATGQLIHKHKLATQVADLGRCVSSCALVFLAGKERSLGKHAFLGFHQPWLREKHPTSGELLTLSLEEIRAYLSSINLSTTLIEHLSLHRQEDYYRPQPSALKRYGITTKPFAAPPAILKGNEFPFLQ